MKRDETILLDIERAALLVIKFKENMDEAFFLDDLKTQSAILHQLMVIGEAVKRLSNDFRSANPQIPWTLIAGMRDKLIHAYDIVDLEEVWHTAEIDIPNLITQLKPLIPKE